MLCINSLQEVNKRNQKTEPKTKKNKQCFSAKLYIARIERILRSYGVDYQLARSRIFQIGLVRIFHTAVDSLIPWLLSIHFRFGLFMIIINILDHQIYA